MELKDIFSFGKKLWDNGGKEILQDAIKPEDNRSKKLNNKGNIEDAEVIEEETISEKMTKEEEEKLIRDCQKSILASKEVRNLFTTLYDKTLDTIKFCEVQKTKRTIIKEQSKQNIEKIRATRDIIIKYLDKSFDERKYLFSKQFEVLDKAIETNDAKLMSDCLNNINALAISSPFKALNNADEFKKMLDSGQTEFDI